MLDLAQNEPSQVLERQAPIHEDRPGLGAGEPAVGRIGYETEGTAGLSTMELPKSGMVQIRGGPGNSATATADCADYADFFVSVTRVPETICDIGEIGGCFFPSSRRRAVTRL
jgi:hypothetical protein